MVRFSFAFSPWIVENPVNTVEFSAEDLPIVLTYILFNSGELLRKV